MEQLPPEQREVLQLRLDQELSLEEIGQITGVGRNREIAAALCDGQAACGIERMNRDEPLTPEERELARLLGRRVEQAPPAALDATILAAALLRTRWPMLLSPPRRRAGSTRPRWPAVFGIAASMVAIGIAWQLRRGTAAGSGRRTAGRGARCGDVRPPIGPLGAVQPTARLPHRKRPPNLQHPRRPLLPLPGAVRRAGSQAAPTETAEAPAARSMAADAAAATSFAALPPGPATAPAAAPRPPAPAAYSAPAPAWRRPRQALARSAEAPVANAADAERAQALDR